MDATRERQFTNWLDLTADLIATRPPNGRLPKELLLERFVDTWDGPVAFNAVDADGRTDVDFMGPVSAAADDVHWFITEGSHFHPLMQWFGRTQDRSPLTLGRVPRGTCEGSGYQRVLEFLAAVGVEQQLAIPCRSSTGGHWAFVLGRSGPDFTDNDLVFARRIQGLLFLLARHVTVSVPADVSRVGDSWGLTVREQVVLGLLAEGMTAASIAHRLGISPRTVGKHLEHIYRKLGVSDRLMAVRLATSDWSRHIEAPDRERARSDSGRSGRICQTTFPREPLPAADGESPVQPQRRPLHRFTPRARGHIS
jgi:DNA-binding CsgD family transcriptional regulator